MHSMQVWPNINLLGHKSSEHQCCRYLILSLTSLTLLNMQQSAPSFRGTTFTLCLLSHLHPIPSLHPTGWEAEGGNGLVNHEYRTLISLAFVHVCSPQVVRRGLINLDLRQALSVRTVPLYRRDESLPLDVPSGNDTERVLRILCPLCDCTKGLAVLWSGWDMSDIWRQCWSVLSPLWHCLTRFLLSVSPDVSLPLSLALLGPVKHFSFGWVQLFCSLSQTLIGH